MTPNEILNEIQKLPLLTQKEISESLAKQLENKEQKHFKQEIWQELFAEGFITHIPTQLEETDDFQPIEIKGKPISETIIEERR